MTQFSCSFDRNPNALPHFWEHTVGSDHALMALRADWQRQMTRAHRELGFRHVRFHGLLNDDMSVCVVERSLNDKPGVMPVRKPVQSFLNIDCVFDFLLSIGMKPFVELSFMPTALASGDETVFHYRGNISPPKNFRRWGRLISGLTTHLIARYGQNEVRQWFFEVWNEPNLRPFWSGSQRQYFQLYQAAAEAIKHVDSALRVGGPSSAQGGWIEDFLQFCSRRRLPIDFITTHQYPNDPPFFDAAKTTLGQLAASRRSFMRDRARLAKQQAGGRPLYYTEWNTSSDPHDSLHDESYAAAFAIKTVMEANGLVDGYSFWTFSDLFEENYMPWVPFHGGFGLLNLHGIPKPVYRAFELLHQLGNALLPVEGVHKTLDAWAVRKEHELTVLITNHALPRHRIDRERVVIVVEAAPRPLEAYCQRIDSQHANPKQVWQEWGRPGYLDYRQVDRLEHASRLISEKIRFAHAEGKLRLELTVPPQAVAAVTLQFPPPTSAAPAD